MVGEHRPDRDLLLERTGHRTHVDSARVRARRPPVMLRRRVARSGNSHLITNLFPTWAAGVQEELLKDCGDHGRWFLCHGSNLVARMRRWLGPFVRCSCEVRDHVAYLTLNRPEAANAINV
jgi:hypothetical protein